MCSSATDLYCTYTKNNVKTVVSNKRGCSWGVQRNIDINDDDREMEFSYVRSLECNDSARVLNFLIGICR